jgi:tetratricopeptide (TPR) repeat protein/predicted phosphodiesterase
VITWLHVSDFHFNGSPGHDEYDKNKVVEPLLASMREHVNKFGPPNFVFATGDIGNSGQSDDYQVARAFFDRLVEACGVTRQALWLVPGNHDINRAAGRALLRTLEDIDASDNWFFARPENRRSHLLKFEAYSRFISEYIDSRPLALGDVVHEPTVLVLQDHRLGILPINSAWFCQDDHDRGKLWLGTRLIREKSNLLRHQGASTVIALMHHPYSYLHEDDTAKGWLRSNADIVLRGHLHTAEVESVVSATGSALEIAAGAAYQGSRWPCRAFWGELNTVSGLVTLHPIRYIDHPSAQTWVVDSEVFPDRPERSYSADFAIPGWTPNVDLQVQPAGFPHATWTAVNKSNWLESIVSWFSDAYVASPENTMREILDHVFDILDHLPDKSNIEASIIDLGEALQPSLPASMISSFPHHQTILDLLAFGINRSLSHLFMLPRVEKEALLEIPDYGRLLLATRRLASGEYTEASALARQIGAGCCVALYVLGQCDRKVELNYEAANKLSRLDRLIERIAVRRSAYPCTASSNMQCLCNIDLLRASVNRAQGVVARRIGDESAAVNFFERAQEAARSALESLNPSIEYSDANLGIATTYDEAPHKVLADVYYSYGYYWYERKHHQKALDLFEKSIYAMSKSSLDVDWDSPYTRLAILRLIEREEERAVDLALTAREICRNTAPNRNREAVLSLAITTLTLRILERKLGRMLIDSRADVEQEIDNALQASPPLGLGPIECHRRDAELLRESAGEAAELADRVVKRLSIAANDVRIEGKR